MDIHPPDRRCVLTAALTALLVTACADRTTVESLPPHHRVRPLEHGVFLPHGPQDGPAFTAMTGAAPRWMLLFRDWSHETPPLDALDAVRAQGATPVLTWEPWYAPPEGAAPADGARQPAFALSRFAAGDHDHRISTWAQALAAWGHDVVLRFAHEMNGTWYPWAAGVQGNTAEQYVRAWRHVHGVFTAAGADNVRWCWAPNVPAPSADAGGARLADCFPGPDVVDVLGIDGYNWGPEAPPLSWTDPEELLGPGLAELLLGEPAGEDGHCFHAERFAGGDVDGLQRPVEGLALGGPDGQPVGGPVQRQAHRRLPGDVEDGGEGGVALLPLEVLRAVLAERADEIRRQGVAFVDVAADLADIAMLFFFNLRLWLRLDMLKVVAVGDRRCVAQDCRFRNLRDKERMRAVIVRVNNLCGDKCIRSERDIGKPVSAACSVCFKTGKLVRILTACKAKPLEGIKRSVFCKNG